jgi:hypothetical protein
MEDDPKTYYVTFSEGSQILGYVTIDRKTFQVVPKRNTMKLSDDDLKSLVADLRGRKALGTLGKMNWHEGRAEGCDAPEDSESNW